MEKITEYDFNTMVERLFKLYQKMNTMEGKELPYSKLQDYLYTKNEIIVAADQVLQAIPAGIDGWITTPSMKVRVVVENGLFMLECDKK